MHLADAFEASALRGPDRPFLVSGSRRLTYGQADQQARALSAAAAGLGVGAGDRIAVILPNWPEWVTTLLAAARLGAAVVPINPSLGWHELTYQLRHAGASLVVCARAWRDRDFGEWLDEMVQDLPQLHVAVVGGEDLWYDDRVVPFADLLAKGQHAPGPAAPRDPSATLAILYTSGTMGKPKGVCLSHLNLVGTARHTADALAMGPGDVSLVAVPCFTVFGTSLVVGAAAHGAALVLEERFDAAQAVASMAREGCTLCHGVPTMFQLLVREPGFTRAVVPALRSGLVAGSPVPPTLLDLVRAVCDVQVAYGLTETGPTVAVTRFDDPPARRRDSVGRALPGVELALVDPAPGGAPGALTVGELAVKGPGVMAGYDRMPAETRRSFTPDGYYLTGDLATVDADGYVRIVGRRKDLIIRGGFNVYPREVEDVLQAHPAVEEICVVGLPHEILGEMICACIVPVEGAIVRGEDILSFAREQLADHKVPDLVRFLDALPLTVSGKVKRRDLAQRLAAELTASQG